MASTQKGSPRYREGTQRCALMLHLPTEIWAAVFAYLDRKDVIKCTSISKTFKLFVQGWFPIFQTDSLTLHQLLKKQSTEKTAESISNKNYLWKYLAIRFPNIQNLALTAGLDEDVHHITTTDISLLLQHFGTKLCMLEINWYSHTNYAFENLLQFRSLNSLSLAHTGITNTQVRLLGESKMPLKDLNLWGNREISNIGPLVNLPTLEGLILWSTKIGSDQAQYLNRLQNLQSLDVSNTLVTNEFLNDLRLPKLRKLIMYNCDVNDTGAGFLCSNLSATIMAQLDLSWTNVSGIGFSKIINHFTALSKFYIWYAKVYSDRVREYLQGGSKFRSNLEIFVN